MLSFDQSSMKPQAEENWEYAFNFDKKFHSIEKKTDCARRRRWHRKLVPTSAEHIVPGTFQMPDKDEVGFHSLVINEAILMLQ